MVDRDHLDLLTDHETTLIVADGPTKRLAWASIYALTGTFGAAAAALAFLDYDCPVVSARPHLYERVGDGRMVIPIDD